MNNHKKLENWYFFAKKASQVLVKIKSELLDRNKETSPTCFNFEIFDHDPSFFNFSQKKASLLLVKKKSELLDQKSLTSPTCCKFEFFYHDPQLDIKF